MSSLNDKLRAFYKEGIRKLKVFGVDGKVQIADGVTCEIKGVEIVVEIEHPIENENIRMEWLDGIKLRFINCSGMKNTELTFGNVIIGYAHGRKRIECSAINLVDSCKITTRLPWNGDTSEKHEKDKIDVIADIDTKPGHLGIFSINDMFPGGHIEAEIRYRGQVVRTGDNQNSTAVIVKDGEMVDISETVLSTDYNPDYTVSIIKPVNKEKGKALTKLLGEPHGNIYWQGWYLKPDDEFGLVQSRKEWQ